MRLLFIIPVVLAFALCGFNENPKANTREAKLAFEINEVKNVIAANSKYNSEIAFFIDMGIESGKFRFFVYNLQTNKIIDEGLVTHGLGSENKINGELKFSNINNSLCTSLGKYSIGNSYMGTYGKAYKLYGLDDTNSNAYNRNIVLHKLATIPDVEQNAVIGNSLGCLVVSEHYFEKLATIIDHSKTNIIMSVYY